MSHKLPLNFSGEEEEEEKNNHGSQTSCAVNERSLVNTLNTPWQV